MNSIALGLGKIDWKMLSASLFREMGESGNNQRENPNFVK